jgi:hypothetical protein
MTDIRITNDCVSVGDLTFTLGEDEYIGLGSVIFEVGQEFAAGMPTLKRFQGLFEPKGESAGKIYVAWDKGKKVKIKGKFRDRRRANKESDWCLENVVFTHVDVFGGSTASFTAKATEYPPAPLRK